MMSPRDLFLRFEDRAGTRRILARDLCDGTALSGVALRERVAGAAARLRKAGIAPGEGVLLAGMTGIPLITSLLAVWSCDAVALPADSQLSPSEEKRLQETFSPRFVLRGEEGEGRVQRVGRPGLPPWPPGTAVVKLTSGSTGRPRGIAVGALHLLRDTEQILQGMGIRPEDLNIAAIPLSHSYGMDSLLMPLVVQGNPILLASPLPDPLARALSIEEPAIFPGTPTLFDLLGRSLAPSFRPRGLRTCLSAGALLRPDTAREFRERSGLPVRVFYGCSETGGISYDASPSGRGAEEFTGCVGTPLPGVEILLEGREGRVVVRGGNVAWGYVGEAGSGADGEFSGRAFRTGDTGRLDREGRLHLTGRTGCLVNVAGRKINPREVEDALMALEGVADAAVLGIPDESRGESILAVVVAEGRVTRERVMAHLRATLAAHKLPRRLLFLKGLPRGARGKLDRGEILRRAGIEGA